MPTQKSAPKRPVAPSSGRPATKAAARPKAVKPKAPVAKAPAAKPPVAKASKTQVDKTILSFAAGPQAGIIITNEAAPAAKCEGCDCEVPCEPTRTAAPAQLPLTLLQRILKWFGLRA